MAKTQSTALSKRDFINLYKMKLGCNCRDAEKAYSAFIETITEELIMGHPVRLSGLGMFILKPHKGQKVRFADPDATIEDYINLKFKPSRVINKEIKANSDAILETLGHTKN